MSGLSFQEEQTLISAIDRVEAFKDCGIAFVGRNMSYVIRESQLPPGFGFWVVISEIETPAAEMSQTNIIEETSNVGSELLNMGLSCGAMVLAGAAATTSAAATPFTFGTSGAITVLTAGAALASAAQCGISTGRVLNEFFSPGTNEQYLDSEAWYEVVSVTLDAVSFAGGVSSLGQSARMVLRMQASSGKSLKQVIRGLNRAERKRLAQDMARYNNQATTRSQFIRMSREGLIPKIFTHKQINDLLIHELLNSVGAAFSLVGSATGGITRSLIVHFAEESA